MGAIFGWLFKQIAPYLTPIIAGLIGLLLISSITLGVLYKNKIEDYAELNRDYISVAGQVTQLQTQIEDEKKEYARVVEERNKVTADFRIVKGELNNLKGRQSTVKAKPKLVEKKINTSFDSFTRDVQCVTGEASACSK